MLHLIVPALGHPWPQPGYTPPETPALDRLLARADPGAGADSYAETLFDLFQVPAGSRATAPFCWLGLQGEPPPGWVMHADPVHFHPDRDRLLLFTLAEGAVSPEEAQGYVRAFNDHFAGEGMVLHALAGQRWFLTLDREPAARFTPLEQAVGRALEEAMPEGAEAARWRQLMNEVQMLFFQLPLNQAREERGELAVNGLWFGGPGRGATSVGRAPRLVSASDDPLLQGLLRGAAEQDEKESVLLFPFLEAAIRQQDGAALATALQRLDTLAGELTRREPEFRLHDCNGHSWHWKSRMRWRFWRRRPR